MQVDSETVGITAGADAMRRFLYNLFSRLRDVCKPVDDKVADALRNQNDQASRDPVALVFWLKNRRPKNWRDKIK
jgi:hypothetical protein